jgi:hypothetical protein
VSNRSGNEAAGGRSGRGAITSKASLVVPAIEEADLMRILLAENALYYPSPGGGGRSNRLLMESLASRGHDYRAISV